MSSPGYDPLRRHLPGRFLAVGIGALLLVGLPPAGILLAGFDPRPYLELPPTTRYVAHAGFSWGWFAWFAAIDLALLIAMALALVCGRRKKSTAYRPSQPATTFPWWGWVGLLLCLAAWFFAWTRLAWFRPFQPHTFFPLWMGFILLVNGLTVKRGRRCLLLRKPAGFVRLFPLSAVFWWLFEYLNRFVQNWWYQSGIENLGPWQYTLLASLAFSTVLPAVLSMTDLLATFPTLGDGLARCRPISLPKSKGVPAVCLAVSCAGLALIGLFPDQLFALLWISPLIIVLGLQGWIGRPTLLRPLGNGDWRTVVLPALAALVCGFFWEMWNSLSLARWSYTIPYVARFHLFEMPLLGYGGYLPFGLACLAVGSIGMGSLFDPVGEK